MFVECIERAIIPGQKSYLTIDVRRTPHAEPLGAPKM
jgi:hypothetical protein